MACKWCHGTGQVLDWVDYGSATVSMPSTCDCAIAVCPHCDHEQDCEPDNGSPRTQPPCEVCGTPCVFAEGD